MTVVWEDGLQRPPHVIENDCLTVTWRQEEKKEDFVNFRDSCKLVESGKKNYSHSGLRY